MYEFYTASNRAEKELRKALETRNDVKDKLDKLKRDPRKASGAHPLHGRLKGKWSCWLGSDLRMIYSINDEEKQIIIEAVGTHKVY